MARKEYVQHVSAEYAKVLADAGINDEDEDQETAKLKVLRPMVDWYKERISQFIEEKKDGGKINVLVSKAVEPLIRQVKCSLYFLCLQVSYILQSAQIHDLYGVQVFGFAIVPDRGPSGKSYSILWGGSPEYLSMRNEYRLTITTQIADYEAMFRYMLFSS